MTLSEDSTTARCQQDRVALKGQLAIVMRIDRRVDGQTSFSRDWARAADRARPILRRFAGRAASL